MPGQGAAHALEPQEGEFEQPAEWPDREPPADLLPDAAGMNRFAWICASKTRARFQERSTPTKVRATGRQSGSYVVPPDDPQRSAVCATGSGNPTRD